MPRANRIKQYDFNYHVMVRSINVVPLFRQMNPRIFAYFWSGITAFYIQRYMQPYWRLNINQNIRAE